MIELPQASNSGSFMPDMTALLDVIFILLIFMMLTANTAPHLLELELPEVAVPAQEMMPSAIILGISAAGEFSIDQQSFNSWDDFQQALSQRLSQSRQELVADDMPQLLVAADKKVALQLFVKLVGWLSQQGLSVAEVVVSDE